MTQSVCFSKPSKKLDDHSFDLFMYLFIPQALTMHLFCANLCWEFRQVDRNGWFLGLPGGAVVENPPANAGDTGLSAGPGGSHMLRSNSAHAPQLLSLCSRAREPQLLSLRATATEACAPGARAPQQERPPRWEARTPWRGVAPTRRN